MIKINSREEFLEKLKTTRDFSNHDLSDLDLSHLDLCHTQFSNAKLTGSKLTGSRLIGANLIGANLRNAIFTGARLRRAGLIDANLTGANFTNANLIGVDFTSAKLIGARFIDADLKSARLIDADLTDTILKEVRLFNAKGNGKEICNLELPDFQSAYNIVYNVQTGEVWIGCFSIEIENLKYLTLEKVEKIVEKKCVNSEETENFLYDFKHSLSDLVEKIEVMNSDKN